jgi:hypothetical protein
MPMAAFWLREEDTASRLMAQAKPWLLAAEHLESNRASIREFMFDRAYLGLGGSVYPAVADALEEVFEGGYEEAVVSWGIGSGKSFLGAVALCYMVHSLLCLRDPQRSLGMAAGSEITLLTMAPSARQARRVVFAEFCALVERGEWFREWGQASSRLAGEFHLPKGIGVVAGNSSPTFALGYNLLGVVIDEAAFFPSSDAGRRERGEEVYESLKHRVGSRFGDRGLVLLISSPHTAGDFLERRIAQARCDDRAYVTRRAVWDVRPAHLYSGERFAHAGLMVPVEYRRAFELNSQRALRDLAAQPTCSTEAFITEAECVDRATDRTRRHPVDDQGRLLQWFQPTTSAPHYVHVDLGLTRDACGMAMARCEEAADWPGSPRVVVDLMWQLRAPPGGEVELARPRELVLALKGRGFNIAQVSYDGWQSADSRQILGRKGIKTRTVSVDRTAEAYETLKELLLDGRLVVYQYDPFAREMRLLELVSGGKIDHPPGGSKDVADAVAGAVSEAVRNWGGGEVRAKFVG